MKIKIGRKICSMRAALKMSQDDFAAKMGVARQTVSSWENDKFIPDTAKIIEMSSLFGCSLDDLLSSNPTPPPRRVRGRPKGAVVAEGII